MNATNATPRPWKIENVLAADKHTLVYCRINTTKVYKQTVAGTSQANAELIVKAVNSYDALLGACKEVLEEISKPLSERESCMWFINKLNKVINQATK